MALVKRGGGFLHKSSLEKFVGKEGYELRWNDKELIRKLDNEVDKIVTIGAKAVGVLAKNMVPIESGALRDSINVRKSQYEKSGILNRRAYVEWIVSAGDTKVDYAAHIELGRYFEEAGTRIPGIPFIRRPLATMRKKMRRLFINRLRRILD